MKVAHPCGIPITVGNQAYWLLAIFHVTRKNFQKFSGEKTKKMGRRSSSGKSSGPSRGFASRAAPAPRSTAPAPHAPAQPPAAAPSGGSFMGSMLF